MLDIHSHILPEVDDGAASLEESVELLKKMKEQGITDVVATPHFDASANNIEDFTANVTAAYERLTAAVEGMELPNILLGSEVYYFPGIGRSMGIRALAIEKSNYILLELGNEEISKSVIKDISNMVYELGLIPIFAHIERYYSEKGFKQLLKLISSGIGYAQINAQSVLQAPYKRIANKLIKHGHASFIATDTHSLSARPPLMREALLMIKHNFGEDYVNVFIKNTNYLYDEIISEKKNR